MIFPRVFTRCRVLLLFFLVGTASAYFNILEPSTGTTWVDGQMNSIVWVKGLLDGVDIFDIELARMSVDGLVLVAKDVPANQGSALNIMVQDVPVGDDYFLIFINSTFSLMYTVSDKFTIAAAGSSTNTSANAKGFATVTASGTPNPTMGFATTFPLSSNSAPPPLLGATPGSLFGISVMAGICMISAAFTLW